MALEYIGRLYATEALAKKQALQESDITAYRQEHAKPVVDAFFAWVWEQRQRIDLTKRTYSAGRWFLLTIASETFG